MFLGSPFSRIYLVFLCEGIHGVCFLLLDNISRGFSFIISGGVFIEIYFFTNVNACFLFFGRKQIFAIWLSQIQTLVGCHDDTPKMCI